MSESHYGITAEDLRTFLAFWPSFSAEANDVQQMLIDEQDKFFGKETEFFAWCHLYELPIKQHITLVNAGIIEGYAKFLKEENLTVESDLADYVRSLYAAPRQALRVTFGKEVSPCHSKNAVTHGTSISLRHPASALDALLALPTKNKRRNCTTL